MTLHMRGHPRSWWYRLGGPAAALVVAVGTGGLLGLPAPAAAAGPGGPVHGTGPAVGTASATAMAEPGSTAPACAPSPAPPFFVDPVAQPPVAAPDGPNHYTLTATLGAHRFASAWPAVPSLGYRTANATASYLGPTIVTTAGQPVDVTLVNGLPPAGTRMFPFDPEGDANAIVLHRHGGLQAADSDGTPGQEAGPGQSITNHYPNAQAAAPLWYHDHSEGTTSYRVYEGLAGYMPNTDAIEARLPLPAGDFAKAYVLQDKSFFADGSMCYSHADPEFFGDLPVVNGTVAPYQAVEPRRYTFTFINGSDSRFFHLSLRREDGAPAVAPRLTVVGSDSGYLLRPVPVSDLLIAPGERYRVVVDFTASAGQRWVLANDAATPYPDGDASVEALPRLMLFAVGTTRSGPDRTRVPAVILETNNALPATALLGPARLRTVQAGEVEPGMPLLGDATALYGFTEPVTETPQLGTFEAWALRNHSPDTHPVHLHLVELRLVGRWPVGRWNPDGTPVPGTIGAFEPAAAYESGPKDTFVAPRDHLTVWVGRFGIAGSSVWHCHILSHEDTTMMRPLLVGTVPQTQLPWIGGLGRLDRLLRR